MGLDPLLTAAGELSMMSETLDTLRGYDTPTLSNAIEVFDCRPRDEGFASSEVRCMFPELGSMVGFAVTATIRARNPRRQADNQLELWEHVQSIGSPRVVVVQDLDDPPGHGALWGEVNASVFKALGCVGAVTNGGVRDLTDVRKTGFHFFAGGVCVSHAYVNIESVGIEVEVGGLRVQPGDLIHADEHGVLLIPSDIADDLASAADAIIEREQRLIRWLRSQDFQTERLAEMKGVRH
jgi:regulator of RNase E activity RraA